MPTLELHGFDGKSGDEMVAAIRPRLADLPYRDDIVFDTTRNGGRVEGWDGSDRRFLRVCSRSQEKLDELRDATVPLIDVETVLIGYFPRR